MTTGAAQRRVGLAPSGNILAATRAHKPFVTCVADALLSRDADAGGALVAQEGGVAALCAAARSLQVVLLVKAETDPEEACLREALEAAGLFRRGIRREVTHVGMTACCYAARASHQPRAFCRPLTCWLFVPRPTANAIVCFVLRAS